MINIYQKINLFFLYKEPIINIFIGYINIFAKYDDDKNNYFYNEIKKIYEYIIINNNKYIKFKQKNNYFINYKIISKKQNLFNDYFLAYVYYVIHNIKFCFS